MQAASTPLLLQPLAWCGRQWRALYDSSSPSSQPYFHTIQKIVATPFLLLATVFAAIAGLGGALTQPSSLYSKATFRPSLALQEKFSQLERLADTEAADAIIRWVPSHLINSVFVQRFENASRLISLTLSKGNWLKATFDGISDLVVEPHQIAEYLLLNAHPEPAVQQVVSAANRIILKFQEEAEPEIRIEGPFCLAQPLLNEQRSPWHGV